MKNIHLILVIAILILVYLISMQWLGRNATVPVTYTPPVKVMKEAPTAPVVTEIPVTPTPVTVEEKTTPETTPVTIDTKTPEITPDVTEENKNPLLIEYKNTNYGYHLSLPKQMYYAGFGARNGALHTLAIQADALPETFGSATVRVSYYGKKTLPELQNTERYVDPNGKFILLLLNNEYSVRIESDNLQSATVKAIESTIGID